jgi:hypothetical protein
MIVFDVRSIETLNDGKVVGMVDIQRMPATITNLQDTYIYFELVKWRTIHFSYTKVLSDHAVTYIRSN